MDHFHYRDSRLHAEDVPLETIAAEVGTPFYCYSRATLQRHHRAYREAFGHHPHRICYSVKCNSNLAVLDTLVRAGAGLDIVSGGELARALAVGCPGERIVFSGVGKTEMEMRAALTAGIGMFNVESEPELVRLDEVARSLGCRAPVSIRVNPDVDARTHPYISTGLKRNKFGIPHARVEAVYRMALSLAGIEVKGIDCHIGSQITELSPFIDAARRIKSLVLRLRALGADIRHVDLGGGLGVPYAPDQTTPQPSELAAALVMVMGDLGVTLTVEPGRSIAGNAGVLVCRVEYVKEGEEKRFIITDAGMNDLLRPALYQAHHEVLPVVRRHLAPVWTVDVVGPVCETGDWFARDRGMAAMSPGELLAVRSAGAYGFCMSSNYNSRPRPAEVMVSGQRFVVVRPRESLADLFASEQMFPGEDGS
ncbi:MAG: diaminopimelate decarboxylase [Magnetococcus sp. WYHC-3]